MIPSPRITATPQLLLPLNNKLLRRKIKHRMSKSNPPAFEAPDSALWPGKLCTDVGRSVTIMTARDNSWHVTMVRSHITHQLLVDRQFRVGHQIWHRSWHGFLCLRHPMLPFHSVRACWTIPIWLNVTQGSISAPLSQNPVLLQMLKLY